MGKIVKYCSSCDEGFGERFTFCPDCGASLQAFEMNPVSGESKPIEEPAPAVPTFVTETPAEQEPAVAFEQPAATEAAIEVEDVDLEYDDARYDYIDVREEEPYFAASTAPIIDDGYHITVIEEKNRAQRNGLLLGASVLMIVFVASATLYSLFSIVLDVNAIGDRTSLAELYEVMPVDTEEEKQNKKDNAGGGGGSGSQEKDPPSKGDLADQSPTPTRPPNVNTPRSDEPMLQTPTTQGNMTFPKQFGKWGLPNGLDGLSNGSGSGGGIGTGNGSGQGNGTGTGAGNGTGSGYGNGNGNGNGNGIGGGSGDPPDIVRVTSAVKILAKPRAQYTDEARTAQLQGVVRLKVTLLANGSVGAITPVSRLGYGLTEQAIAAARQIRFEPKKVNGVPQSTIMTFEYSFSIY
jgi:protein TonB